MHNYNVNAMSQSKKYKFICIYTLTKQCTPHNCNMVMLATAEVLIRGVCLSANLHGFYHGTRSELASGLEAGDRQRYGSSRADNNQMVNNQSRPLSATFHVSIVGGFRARAYSQAPLCMSHLKPNSARRLHGRSKGLMT